MTGHYLSMPFKPHGQEEWVDTSDEDMDESDYVEDDDSDEDYEEEWVPNDLKDPSSAFSVQLLRANTSGGNYQQQHLLRSQTPGLNTSSHHSDKDSTTTNMSEPVFTSKKSTSTDSFKEDKQESSQMKQTTSSDCSSQCGTKTQEEHHLQQPESQETHKSTEATMKTSAKNSTIEPFHSLHHPRTETVPVRFLHARRSGTTKNSEDSATKCKSAGLPANTNKDLS